jgi:Leucine-rich repeat (LRR) protein
LQGLPAELPVLQNLNFYGNKLVSLEGMPVALSALQELDLDSNKLVSLQGMSELPALQYLNLWGNQLSDEVKQEIKEKYPFAIGI